MPSIDEQIQTCWFCKKRPATAQYTRIRTQESSRVCAACLDRLEVQDALEDQLLHISDLEGRKQYDEALACLDQILEANRHRDHDRWLVRSIAMHRAHILFGAGRYADAEQACRAWADVGFDDVWRRWMHGSLTAQTLDALGRTREGLAVLEEALSHQEPREIPGAYNYLATLAELSEKLGQPVDPKWRSLAEASAASYGVEFPEQASLNKILSELLPKAIQKANRARRGEPEVDEDDEDDEDEDEP